MKKKLLKMLKVEEEARQLLLDNSKKSEDIGELRSIQSQIEASNSKIAEIKNLLDDIEKSLEGIGAEGSGEEGRESEKDEETEESERTRAINKHEKRQREGKQESHKYTPGRGFSSVDGGGSESAEERSKKEQSVREKRGKDLKEGRAITVGSSTIVIPTHYGSDIRPTFNQISSLIDNVRIMPLTGGESFTQPYLIDVPEGGYTLEKEEYSEADAKFGKVDIIKSKITAYSETTEEVKKLPAADYESVIMSGITKSMRRKMTRQILIGDGGTNRLVGIFSDKATAIDPASDLPISTITNTTLDDILFGYGYDEDVESVAMLILNKLDLKAFSQLRTNDGKKFHNITTNGNTGTIDGVPFIINSACGAIASPLTPDGTYCMAYGLLDNYMLAIFSDTDVQRSEDFKFKTGEIAFKGSVFLGGNVVSHNGFLRVKKGTAI